MAVDPAHAQQLQKFAKQLSPEKRKQLIEFLQRRAKEIPTRPQVPIVGHGGGHSVAPLIIPRSNLNSRVENELDEYTTAETQRFFEQSLLRDMVSDLEGGIEDGPEFDPTAKNKTFNRVNPLYNKHRNVLGATVNVKPGSLSLPVGWVQCDEEDSTVFTVTSYAPNPVFSGFTDQIRPYVKVTWGTRVSQLAQVTVDVGLGAQFSLCGSAIFVEVGSDLGKNGGIFPFGVTAFIGYNTTQRQSPSPRTLYIDNLGPGLSKTFNVPNFATTLQTVQRDNTTVKMTLDFIAADGTTSFEYIQAANTFFTNNIPLSNDVVQIKVTNNDGAATINGRIVCGLSL